MRKRLGVSRLTARLAGGVSDSDEDEAQGLIAVECWCDPGDLARGVAACGGVMIYRRA